MDKKTFYLAGPMSGIAQFNFPLFYKVTELLRGVGMSIVSPAELDAEHGVDQQALASTDGDAKKLSQTWGDLLARDVKLIADGVQGIVFLPQWSKSRGAKLEAFVGLLQTDFEYWEFFEDETGWTLLPVDRLSVLALITAAMGRPT